MRAELSSSIGRNTLRFIHGCFCDNTSSCRSVNIMGMKTAMDYKVNSPMTYKRAYENFLYWKNYYISFANSFGLDPYKPIDIYIHV